MACIGLLLFVVVLGDCLIQVTVGAGSSVEGVLPGKRPYYVPLSPVAPLFATGGLGGIRCPGSQQAIARCFFGFYGTFGCPLGSSCYAPTATCCRNNFATQICDNGETGGSCGGMRRLQCQAGSTCLLPPNYIMDAPGKCCWNSSPFAVSGGGCPPYESGLCVYRINQCMSDWQCPTYMKCCPDTCGNRCKHRIYN